MQSYYKIASFGQFVAVATPKGNISILSLPELKPIYQHKTSHSKGNLTLYLLMSFSVYYKCNIILCFPIRYYQINFL